MEPARFLMIKNFARAAKVGRLPFGMLTAPIIDCEGADGKRLVKMSFNLAERGPRSAYIMTVTADPERWYAIEDVTVESEPLHQLGLGTAYYVDEFGDWRWIN